MANYPKYDLTGKTPAETYNELVQFNSESSSLVTGLGNDVPPLNITASQATSASWAPVQGSTAFSVSSSWASSSISASVASNLISSGQVFIHAVGSSLIATATTNIILDATGALFMSADTANITMTPNSTVEIQGNLLVDGTASLATLTTPGVLVNNAQGLISSQVGLTATKSFIDGNQTTQSVHILNGLIIGWTP